MSAETEATPLDKVLVADREMWRDGPPHETFKRMRAACPIHWTPRLTSSRRRTASGR